MGFVRNIVEDVGDFIGDTVQHIVDDPLQAIVTVGAMAMGVPPVWAGALGGAAGAAEHGGNILEGAALGGAAGYVGGAAGGLAAEAGAGAALSGAAGGAAAGATVGALTGGDIIKSALTGAAGGALSGTAQSYFSGANGSTTYTYDDGSTVTYGSDGKSISSTPATDGTLAPVYEYNPETYKVELVQPGTGSTPGASTLPVSTDSATGMLQVPHDMVSTGYSDSAPGTIYHGANGPEIVLDSGKTVLLSDYQAALQSGGPVSIDGMMQTGMNIEVSGAPKYAGHSGAGAPPEGFEVANPEDVFGPGDTNNAQNPFTSGTYLDPDTDTWFRPKGAVAPGAGDTGPGGFVAPTSTNADGSTSTHNYNGSITTTFDDGTTLTSNADGTYTSRDSSGKITVGESGSEGSGGINSGNGTTYVYDDGSTITIHPDGTSTSTPAPGTEVPTATTTPDTVTPAEVPVTDLTGTPVTPGVVTPYTPIFPITTPKPKVPGVDDTYTPPQIGNLTKPITDIGLSPGFVKPTPFYDTTNDIQNQYYWGSHGFQTEDTFDPTAYNQVPAAPAHGWGLQQQYQQLTPEQIAALVRDPAYQAQFGGVAGPVAPGGVQ